MAGTLFVVATPIGNLEDITLRAIRVLREVDLIAAEDTRRTARLLAHLGISTPSTSFHAHNTRSRLPHLISRLKSGLSIALVSDAGTPGVSDPGLELVQACIAEQIPIDPIPGVSAPLAAVVASGFPVIPLTILGFPPPRSKDRTCFLTALYKVDWTMTLFEAPHRLRGTLSAMAETLGDRQIVVARELTKRHQELLRGTPASVLDSLHEPRGEFTIVIAPRLSVKQPVVAPSDEAIHNEFGKTTKTGSLSRGASITAVAKTLGLPRRQVYAAIERLKQQAD